MTNKLVVIINNLKVPKIRKILLCEMKFLVPNYSCLQNPRTRGLPLPDPRSLCPLSSTEFVEIPPPRTKFLGTPLLALISNIKFHENRSTFILFFYVVCLCVDLIKFRSFRNTELRVYVIMNHHDENNNNVNIRWGWHSTPLIFI